ncbi:MAG: hypothetical protein OZSIB_2095 [Candidatus Ozemobacter sibiricus]|jgi:hypothetical protein|uniref:DUF5666 domain-containing protein n=1 Tax=Candidatus Ozemobacter sibiricus TaxID=2268124 RepID=A0A367ZT53_9BACT|nr:MAG: hypothetical protein OZSIB_2095 [Candidatus Ozemobacter sibiricus]
MIAPCPGSRHPLILGLILFALLAMVAAAHAEEVKAIGQVESLYRGRVSMRVLEVVSPASATAPLKVGDRVSFNLPKASTRRDKSSIQYGNVIEVDLLGNVATEYDATDPNAPPEKGVLLWTARRAERVKNPRKYLEPDHDDGTGKGRRKGKRKKDKEKEPPQIWTQEEVVVGKVLLHNQRLYLKEDRLRPRDRGLDVLSDEWYEKLKPYVGQKVVAYGTTHRVSISSGTMEIKNVMKIYPK